MRSPGPFEVVVVGSGPAGACAAYHLARAGVRVALVERARFPRAKVCGDGLTPRALAPLREMGVWDAVAPHAIRIHRLRTLDLREGRVHEGPLPGSQFGAVVSRAILDDALREAAVRAGAVFFDDRDVRGLAPGTDGRTATLWALASGRRVELAAEVVIAADGAAGAVSAPFRPPARAALEAIELRQYVRTGPLPACFTICAPIGDLGAPAFGYGWVLPGREDVANVGLRLMWPRGARPLARGIFARFLGVLRSLDPALAGARPLDAVAQGATGVGFRLDGIGSGRVLLAGDSAAVTNAFTGEGVAQALASGRAAAEAAQEHLGGRDGLTAYRDRLAACFPESTRLAPQLGWLAERGGMFAAEFFEVISWRIGLTGSVVRSIALDQPVAGAPERPSLDARVAGTWQQAEDRIVRAHPMLAQIMGGIRRAVATRLDSTIERFWSRLPEAPPSAATAGVALAHAALALCLVDDTGDARADAAGKAVGGRSGWATNALALGAADVLVADLFALLAEVPTTVAASCVRALAAVLRDGAGAAAADRLGRPRLELDDFLRLADEVALAVTGMGAEAPATAEAPSATQRVLA